ncbi:MAG: EthD domain-containing protein [Candidatus Odyssella sp.]|nr:EthD domain-containing protein [Candidatus Odyssella sp.]
MAADEKVSYFVRYRGLAPPIDGFASDYCGRHVDILRGWPGIERIVVHTPLAWRDPFPVRPDGTDFLTEMTFASADALRAALGSEARARARADGANLMQGAAQVTHQAMRSLRLL